MGRHSPSVSLDSTPLRRVPSASPQLSSIAAARPSPRLLLHRRHRATPAPPSPDSTDLGAADGSIFLPTLPRASAPRLCPHSIPQSILTAARFSSTLTNADPIPGAYTHGMAR
ncbi:uncharacterized protein LOC110429903 [Sorghum bicolor]|uniref:Uncharacterized protein n=1 Tax=Sorghum bicolor TaxID=4558 RepID=A0A1Z5R5Y8_SORBI|nr:uncharacterized protein LOC110429903 [Sorghum bicolor]OQU79168.1 hypothetical protein SORBI_3008G104350 [Sorghum bicolor]|eukprot:XP_021302317.1 uncharacterized protein LOC110429903 [Sorghum bicolor]